MDGHGRTAGRVVTPEGGAEVPGSGGTLRAVPLLGFADVLPREPRRVIVGGTSGSGKSTLARAVAARLGLPYQEVDSLYHGPGWTVRPGFPVELRAFTAQPRWVLEWQGLREHLAAVADTLVWLDYPTWLVMYRVVKRTLRRAATRQELWAGNVEPPLWTFFSDPEHIVRWAWRTRHRVRDDVARLLTAGTHLQVVRLRWPHETEAWLERLGDERRPWRLGPGPQTPPYAE